MHCLYTCFDYTVKSGWRHVADVPLHAVAPGHAAGEVSHVSLPGPAARLQLAPSKVITVFLPGNPGSRRFLREGESCLQSFCQCG